MSNPSLTTWTQALPVVTFRGLALLLVPALLALVVDTKWLPGAYLAEALVLTVCAVDFLSTREARRWRVSRNAEKTVAVYRPFLVTVEIHRDRGLWLGPRLSLTLRDVVNAGMIEPPKLCALQLLTRAAVTYVVTPTERGTVTFSSVAIRVPGRFGLCQRDVLFPLASTLLVFPDLSVLSRDALTLANTGRSAFRRPASRHFEGSEFDFLRPYSTLDPFKHIDWKASAKRTAPLVRVLRPEQNQTVYLFLDCGRHLSGTLAGKKKLDLAVDAALRVATAALHQGDHVGVVAFTGEKVSMLPAKKGQSQLFLIATFLQPLQAQLMDSDLTLAISTFLGRPQKRSLVLFFAELDDESNTSLLRRQMGRLQPKHLPLVVSFIDPALRQLTIEAPETRQQAAAHVLAAHFLEQTERNLRSLREVGARVTAALPDAFGPKAVEAYLEVKAKGLL